MKITHDVTPEYRQKLFIETGRQLPVRVETEVDATTLSQVARESLDFLTGQAPNRSSSVFLSLDGVQYIGRNDQLWQLSTVPGTPTEWEAELTSIRARREVILVEERRKAEIHLDKRIADIRAAIDNPDETWVYEIDSGSEKVDKTLPRYPEIKALYDKAVSLFRERKEASARKEREERENREAAEKAEREKWEQEKRAWVEAHGSDKLKAKCAAGYDCQKHYVLARARMEYPGYTVDWQDAAEWRDRSCPSDAAFEEAQRVGGVAVWLRHPPATEKARPDEYDYDAEPFQPCDAVVIRAYLGKYDLVKEM